MESMVYANLKKFKPLRSADQLKEGVVLIDRHAQKRTVILITPTHVTLGHKGGQKSGRLYNFVGKEHRIDDFFRKYGNDAWIFNE